MDFFKVIKKRRSIRKFKKEKIPRRFVEKILKTAILAPSEGNLQPWFFVVVENSAIKEKIFKAGLNQEAILEADFVIVVCIDLKIATSKYGERGKELYSKQSTAAATQNMLLAATALGLGACWIGAFDENKVREILDLDENFRPVVLVPLGWPAESGTFWGRKKIKEISLWK